MDLTPPRDVSWYDPIKAGARCDLCPLKGSRFVPFEAPKERIKLAIVGEGPGRKEIALRSPFCGITGHMLNDELREVGIDRDTAHVSNAALCLGDTDKENERAAECCAPRLLKELAELPKDIPIIVLGKAAAKSVLGVKSILLARGFVWTARDLHQSVTNAETAARKVENTKFKNLDVKKEKVVEARLRVQTLKARQLLAGRTILPTLHPTFAFIHNETWSPIFHIDMDRAARWIRGDLTSEMLEDRIEAVTSLSALKKKKNTFLVTDNVEALQKASKILGNEIACDIETERLKPLTPLLAKIFTVQLSDGDRSIVIAPWDKRIHAEVLTKFLKGRTVVFHNGYNFDEPALERDGVSFEGVRLEDTLVANHAFASQFPQKLDHVVSTFLDSSPWKIRFGVRGAEEKGLAPTHMEEDELALYGACDAVLTIKAWRSMQKDLDAERAVYEHDKLLGIQSKMMQVDGFRVDRKRKKFLALALKNRAASLKGRMRSIAKKPEFAPSRLGEVRRILFGTLRAPMLNPTATGLASTSNATLEQLRTNGIGTKRSGPADTQEASGPIKNETGTTRVSKFSEALLRWRVTEKIRGTYIDAVQVHKDGRAHYTWRPYATNSGRLGCRLQSCPRWSMAIEDRPREIYVASAGNTLLYFDLSQAESRFAANLSGDENFIATCKGDVHTGNAKILFPETSIQEMLTRDSKGKHCPKHGEHSAPGAACNCGKPYRDIAKNAGFAVAYLAEAPTVFAYLRAHGFPVELGDVEDMLDALKASYRRYYEYVAENIAFVEKHGYLRTAITGRIRWFGYHPKPTEIANCLDYETEALTQDGWKRAPELQVGEKLLTKNAATGALTWEPIKKLYQFPQYTGKLYEFKSKSFNALTTPEHRWLVTDRRACIDRCVTSEELAKGTGELSIHRTGQYAGSTATIYTDDFVELVGWILTDGGVTHGRGGGKNRKRSAKIAVYQTKRRNVCRIDALFARLGGSSRDVRHSHGKQRIVWRLSGSSSLTNIILKLFPRRTLDYTFLLALTTPQLHLLRETMMLGDGSETGSHRGRFICRDRDRADLFQILCTYTGIATTTQWRGPSRPKKQYTTIANRPKSKGVWIVSLLHRDKAQVLRHPRRYGKAKARVDQVRTLVGRPVWCPNVANTYFVVRRHGDVYITGNTPIQSGIADIMNIRLLALQERMRREGLRVRLVAQVHDAAILDTPLKEADTVKKMIVETWEEPVRLKPSIVCRAEREFLLPAEIKTGPRWSSFG